MALWQCEINFIYRDFLLNTYNHILERIDDNVLQSASRCIGKKFEFSSILPVSQSWNPNILVWGNIDSNYWETCPPYTALETLARIDIRNLSLPFINNILIAAKNNNCLLFFDNMEIIEPQLDMLIKRLELHDSFKFACNPQEFLKNHSKPN
jgi:hypothetical protein